MATPAPSDIEGNAMSTSSRKMLAAGLVAEVELCACCEIVHVHVGALTLRVKPAVLHDLRDTLSRALAAMPGRSEVPATATHAGRGTCH